MIIRYKVENWSHNYNKMGLFKYYEYIHLIYIEKSKSVPTRYVM